jgi:hypothetical protein
MPWPKYRATICAISRPLLSHGTPGLVGQQSGKNSARRPLIAKITVSSFFLVDDILLPSVARNSCFMIATTQVPCAATDFSVLSTTASSTFTPCHVRLTRLRSWSLQNVRTTLLAPGQCILSFLDLCELTLDTGFRPSTFTAATLLPCRRYSFWITSQYLSKSMLTILMQTSWQCSGINTWIYRHYMDGKPYSMCVITFAENIRGPCGSPHCRFAPFLDHTDA